MSKKFWTVWKQIAFTIMLAILAVVLFGCSPPSEKFVDVPLPSASNGETDAAYLQHLYEIYNEQYFQNHLDKAPKINIELTGNNMADTWCDNPDGTGCAIRFNMHYVAAPRVGQTTILHEMCHIKVWPQTFANQPLLPSTVYDHGRSWRSCMLALDMQGAFRQINIDFYNEEVR